MTSVIRVITGSELIGAGGWKLGDTSAGFGVGRGGCHLLEASALYSASDSLPLSQTKLENVTLSGDTSVPNVLLICRAPQYSCRQKRSFWGVNSRTPLCFREMKTLSCCEESWTRRRRMWRWTFRNAEGESPNGSKNYVAETWSGCACFYHLTDSTNWGLFSICPPTSRCYCICGQSLLLRIAKKFNIQNVLWKKGELRLGVPMRENKNRWPRQFAVLKSLVESRAKAVCRSEVTGGK